MKKYYDPCYYNYKLCISDPADVITTFNFVEEIPLTNAITVRNYIKQNLDTFVYPNKTLDFINDVIYTKEKKNGIIYRNVQYSTFYNPIKNVTIPGRFRVDSNSVFTQQRIIRNSLINNNYVDVDMKNAHMNILKNIIYQNHQESNYKNLYTFIDERDTYVIPTMQYLFVNNDDSQLTKLNVKNFIFGYIYSYQDIKYIADLYQLTGIKYFPRFFKKWYKGNRKINVDNYNSDKELYTKTLIDFCTFIIDVSDEIDKLQTYVIRLFADNTNYVDKIYYYLNNNDVRKEIFRDCVRLCFAYGHGKCDVRKTCYNRFNVVFRLIIFECEKQLLYSCIQYTMKKLNITNNLSAILCHDGFLLNRKYFRSGKLNYEKFLHELHDYIYSKFEWNIMFEYKNHYDEIIDILQPGCICLTTNYEETTYDFAQRNNIPLL